jgi:hypothetical protein
MAAGVLFDDEMALEGLFAFHEERDILSLDEFNYCSGSVSCPDADDLKLYTGVPLEEIYAVTDKIQPAVFRKTNPFAMDALCREIHIQNSDRVEKSCTTDSLRLVREADDDGIVWIRTDRSYPLSDYTSGNRIGFLSNIAEKTGNVRCQIEYYDEEDTKLGYLNFELDGLGVLRIPDHAKSFKLIFRMRGKGSVTLRELCATSPEQLIPAPFPLKKSLLIAGEYPDYEDRERGKELHAFAREHDLEVLKVSKEPCYLPYSEYERVQIITAQYEAIGEYLAAGEFETIYVDSALEDIGKYLPQQGENIVLL